MPCKNPQALDSAVIYHKMIGSWKWEKEGCPPGLITPANKNVVATFHSQIILQKKRAPK